MKSTTCSIGPVQLHRKTRTIKSPRRLPPILVTWATTALLLFVSLSAQAGESSGQTECETWLEEVTDTGADSDDTLQDFLANCDPCDWPTVQEICDSLEVGTDPWIQTHIDASFDNCEGVREHIKKHDVTVTGGGGVVVAGKAAAAFGFVTASYTQETKGWSWSFTCDLAVDSLYAEGGGSVDREVAIYGTTHGDTKTEASCVYLTGECSTQDAMEGTWTISFESDGVTGGYPTKASAELSAYGVNQPADREPLCINHHICTNPPSLGGLIDGRAPVHAPAWSGSADIKWKVIGLGLGDLLEPWDPDPL